MLRSLLVIWKKNSIYIFGIIASAILVGIMTPLTVRCEERIINLITQILNHLSPVYVIIVPFLQLIGVYIGIYIVPALTGLLYERIELNLDFIFHKKLIDKMQTIRYDSVENKDIMDLFSRINKNMDSMLRDFVRNYCDLITAFISVLGFFIVICSVSFICASVFLGLFIILLFFTDRSAKNFYKLNRQFSETERRVVYLDSIENTKSFAHEKKLFGFTDYINQKRSDFLFGQRNTMRQYDYKYGLTFSMIDTAGYICTILLMITMLTYILDRRIGPGLFIAASHAAVNLNLTTQNKIRTVFNELMKQKRFWKEYYAFLDLPNQDICKIEDNATFNTPVEFNSLEFRNVTFQYPNGTKVLDKINFRLEKGKQYALVGENGAGKTTIIKLLLRLYEVDEGDILLNEKSIKEYSQEELYRFYSAVFQDFSRYYISIYDNITFGQKMLKDKMEKILCESNLSEKINNLPNKINTRLGEIYEDGINLSGGEWQRIAFARAICHEAPIILLDEPTSAFDPIAENAIYEQFGKIVGGKTTLFITHRLASTKMADEILVLANGMIVEHGTHKSLMDIHGLYEKMYNSQRKWYAKEGAI